MGKFFDRFRASAPEPDMTEGGAASITPHDLERIDRANRELRAAWDQLPGESDADYALFGAYLAMPSGNVAAFARQVHDQSAARIATLAHRRRWAGRRSLWRLHLAREARQAAEGTARALGVAHAEAWAQAREWAELSMAHHIAEGKILAPADARAMLRDSTTAERLNNDQSTEIKNFTIRADATLDDIQLLDALIARKKAEKPKE